MEILTDWPERLAVGTHVWIEGAAEPTRISAVESGGRSLVLYLEALTTRDGAEWVAGA